MIINRSFITEVLRTALAVTFVIISIFLVLRVMGFLSQAAEGIIPVDAVLNLVALKMVSYLDLLLPLMFYIALIMVLNRWYADHEMAVLAAAGVGITHFLRPLGILAIILTSVIAFFSFSFRPWAPPIVHITVKKARDEKAEKGDGTVFDRGRPSIHLLR